MSGRLVSRGKRYDITSLDVERINLNFDQLFTDVRRVVEDVNTLAPPALCQVYNDGAQAIPDSAYTLVAFNRVARDDAGVQSTPTRLTIPTGGAGCWRISAFVQWAPNATGIRILTIQHNGVAVGGYDLALGNGTYAMSTNHSVVVDAAVGDRFEVAVYQNSGGSLGSGAAGPTTSNLSRLTAHRLAMAR